MSNPNYFDNFFDRTASRYTSDINGYLDKFKLNLILKYAGVNDLVLDVGVANGIFLIPVATHVGFIYGIDMSNQMLRQCRDRLSKKKLKNVRLQKMDACHLKFPDSKFDLVYSFSTLTYVKKPVLATGEIHRVLKVMGIAIIDLPNSKNLEGPYWSNWHFRHGGWGQNLFNLKNITMEFSKMGFNVNRLEAAGLLSQFQYLRILGLPIRMIMNKSWFCALDKCLSRIFPNIASRWFFVLSKTSHV